MPPMERRAQRDRSDSQSRPRSINDQTTSMVFMVRPVRFLSNDQTVPTNAFQRDRMTITPEEAQQAAELEFDALVRELRTRSIEVIEVQDTVSPHTPDSIFPNNWISFHSEGTIVLYPMQAPNRRAEVRQDVVDLFLKQKHLGFKTFVDLRYLEASSEFLEGTGSLVLDRRNRLAYACLSPRTSERALAEFCERLSFESCVFHAVDRSLVPIYHTNVMMAIGNRIAVACIEAVAGEQERRFLRSALTESGRDLLELSIEQMEAFAGNMLELTDPCWRISLGHVAEGSVEPEPGPALEARRIRGSRRGRLEHHRTLWRW